ncbi:hypothetical protein EDD11_003827 [Mortierella claussenii]|nr:hypothetical protein EDD11_003827 [Mortierella claussenii]
METILRLFSQDNTGAALRRYFEETDPSLESVDQISNLVVESLQMYSSSFQRSEYGPDCLSFIRVVLKASPEEGDGMTRRLQVLKGSITWLIQAGEESSAQHGKGGPNASQLDEVASKVVNALIDVGQSFDQNGLVQHINLMIEVVRHQRHPHPQMFSLLSRMLVIAATADSVTLPGSSEDISGVEFKSIIVDRICTAPWNPKSVLPLATALADIDMENKQLEMAIVKIMKQFKQIDATDLPVLIYNLLLLSSKGHQRLVLRGTLEFFDRLNAGGSMIDSLRSSNPKGAARLAFSELSAIESTVILHFSFAVKQDQELGAELLKHMKSGKTAYLSSFSLACLMTMARIHRFEDNVMDYLKSSISTVFKDAERMQREPWVLDFEGMSPLPIFDMFHDIIRKIPYGLEQLSPSLVQCGVYIMDTMAPRSHWASQDKDAPKKSTSKSPNDFACELGAAILAETFKTQASARTEILDHIMSRIVTKSTSTIYFLQLLETIVNDSSDALEEHLPRIKESLDYLSFLSLTTAVRLMAAVKGVAKSNRSFRDSLILILRKALFSKTLESRQVALSGFLLLLGPSPQPQLSLRGGSSRAGVQQNTESALPAHAMEILGMLRRCLGQQGEVRLALYIGLMELVETVPYLNPIIFEILQAHFSQFYDQTGTRLSPLKLEECVGNSKTGDDIIADEQQVAESYRVLDMILLGLERAGLEDFELDKTSDFNMATNIGARNNMYATLLNGCYESALEYLILKQPLQTESSVLQGKRAASDRGSPSDHTQREVRMCEGSSEAILQLFGKMRKLHDIVKEKVVMPRGRRMGPLGETSVLGLESTTRLMEFMFAERKQGERSDEEALKLKANDDFVYYIGTVVHMLLSKLHNSVDILKDSEYDYCRRLSSVLVREFLANERPDGPKAVAAGAKGKDKNKSLLMIGIEALTSGLLTIQRFYATGSSAVAVPTPEELHNRRIASAFLAATLPQVNGGHRPDQQASDVVAWTTSCTIRYDMDSLAAAYIQFLQRLLVMFVNDSIPLLKEAAGLLNMIQVLSRYLSRVDTTKALSSADNSDVLRATSDVSIEDIGAESKQLDQLIHWLIRLCRDQALDDASLTRALVSMTLQLEQECANPQANADLCLDGDDSRGEAPSFGFGNVTSVSLTTHAPEAATRLRLAADVMLTYGLNYGGPQVPSFHELPSRVPQGEEVDEDTARLIQLRREVGVEARFAVVTLRTSSAITEVLLQQVDRSLESLEWAMGKLRYCGLVQTAPSLSDRQVFDQQSPDHGQKKTLAELETDICWRVETCLWILVRIAQSCITQTSSEHLMRVLQRGYRVLAILTKYYLTPPNVAPLNLFSPSSSSSTSSASRASSNSGNHRKGTSGHHVIQLPHAFLRVTQVAGMELSRYLYSFLSYFQMLDVEEKTRVQERAGGGGGGRKGGKKDDKDRDVGQHNAKNAAGRAGIAGVSGAFKSRQKAKILRESKLIPTLIYAVEQYERYVIQLSKKAKVNLTQFMRRSTARDFRIQIQRLGDLGLEDRYEEERQQLLMQEQEKQQQLEQQQIQDEGMQVDEEHDTVMAEYEGEEQEEDEESLVRQYKRVKRA